MIADDLPLSRAAVDRTAVARGDDGLVARARADASTRVLLVRDGSVVTRVNGDEQVGTEGWGRQVGSTVAVAYLDPDTAEAVARAAAADVAASAGTTGGTTGGPADGPADGTTVGTTDGTADGTTGDRSPWAAGLVDDAEPGDGGWLFLGRDADGDVLARRVRPEHRAPRSGASADVLVHRPTPGSGAAAEAAIAASTEVADGTTTSSARTPSSPRTSSSQTPSSENPSPQTSTAQTSTAQTSTAQTSTAQTSSSRTPSPTTSSPSTSGPAHQPLPGLRWTALRAVGAELSHADAGLATTAVALDAWHARHPRCPRCGAPTTSTAAGWVRRCTADDSEHYPRTDPAVIMSVVDAADRLLLGHAAAWAPHRFSTLAGFVEAGESVEHAVRREVAEETTVLVGDVEYVGSQPWPFPASLMLGFRARALSTDVVVDGVELTEARWFTRDELAAAVATGDLVLPSPASIAHALVQDWYGGPVPTVG